MIRSRRRVRNRVVAHLLYTLGLLLPWRLRRQWLSILFGYDIHPSSHIGYSWVMPERLVLGEGARIGHMTVCRILDLVELGPYASIGQWNWITGIPAGDTEFYQHMTGRRAEFVMGPHSAVTSRHYVDCAGGVAIGAYATVAGIRSQIFTHSLDIEQSRQSAQKITIGSYTMIGTGSILLPGSSVPDRAVVGAGSVVTGSLDESLYLYAGVPARPIRKLPASLMYFHRTHGRIF
jgi:acetyltransferase-like isoleucine patch superfamily enzyme